MIANAIIGARGGTCCCAVNRAPTHAEHHMREGHEFHSCQREGFNDDGL